MNKITLTDIPPELTYKSSVRRLSLKPTPSIERINFSDIGGYADNILGNYRLAYDIITRLGEPLFTKTFYLLKEKKWHEGDIFQGVLKMGNQSYAESTMAPLIEHKLLVQKLYKGNCFLLFTPKGNWASYFWTPEDSCWNDDEMINELINEWNDEEEEANKK